MLMTSTAFGAHNRRMIRPSITLVAAGFLKRVPRILPLVLFFFLSQLPLSAMAWNAAGHRLVAHIAWEQLDPRSRAEASRLLQSHPDHGLWVKRSKDTDLERGAFVEASTWPDDIRKDSRFYHAGKDEATPLLPGFADMQRHSDWHFVNLRLDRSPADQPLSGLLDKQLPTLVKTLAATSANSVDRSMALPWLIHLVGDAHQPLHTSVRTDANGKWDTLGQGLTVINPFNPRRPTSTLHAFWDDLPGPPWLRGERLASTVQVLIDTYPSRTLSSATQTWISESWQIARDHGYPTSPDDPPTLSVEFFDKSREIARQRVTQAGYRLAEQLNAAFRQ
jgi:hypothetical protein